MFHIRHFILIFITADIIPVLPMELRLKEAKVTQLVCESHLKFKLFLIFLLIRVSSDDLIYLFPNTLIWVEFD